MRAPIGEGADPAAPDIVEGAAANHPTPGTQTLDLFPGRFRKQDQLGFRFTCQASPLGLRTWTRGRHPFQSRWQSFSKGPQGVAKLRNRLSLDSRLTV